MTGRLEGKVAIVTGAGTGLGREVARLYAREGASVVVADIREADGEATARSIRDEGGAALHLRADVSSSDDVRALVSAAEEEFGALHVMTANAGILGRGATKVIEDLADDEIADVFDVNLMGVVHCFRHAIPAIRRAGGGAMTATSSISAQRGSPALPIYCASKGGVEALVRAVAVGLWPTIRVNAVAAGSMATQILDHWLEDNASAAANARALGGTAVVTTPEEVARVHLFLASDDAAFVTGQALLADGGRAVAQPA